MRTIPKKETLTIEFKSDTKEKNGLSDIDLIETVVGMTNQEGGTVYVGIEDDGTITGLTKKHKDTIGVTALIANNTVPSISVRAEIINENKLDILQIDVPKSRTITACANGKILRRRLKFDGTPEAVPLFPYEISSRLSDLNLLDFSASPLEDSNISDFDIFMVEQLKNIIRSNPGSDKTLLELNQDDFFKALHFTTQKYNENVPTVTGLIFLGKEESIRHFLPTYRASFQVLTGTKVKINTTSFAPLTKTLDEFSTYFNAWNPEKEIEHGLFRISIPEFSFSAFREGLLNAFCHRDYTQLGEIRVLIDDEGLSISSKGGFIDGVNAQNLISVEPHGKNPCLADVLKRIGLVEKTGRGIDRIFEGSIVYGRPWPDYSDSTSQIVKLFIPRSKPNIQFTKMIIEEQNKRNITFSINALMILSTLCNEGKTSIEKLTEKIHLNKSRIIATIETLIEYGLIIEIHNKNDVSYVVNPKVYKEKDKTNVNQPNTNTSNLQNLIKKLARDQNGIVTKKDISTLLNITDVQAYNLIKKLVKEKFLSQNNKGKYSNYKLIK